MNKSDLIRKLAKKHGLPVVLVQKVVNDLFCAIKEDVLAGNTTAISGFGNFYLKKFNSRRGINVVNGTEMTTPDRQYPVFDPSATFKQAARKRGEKNENGT